MALLQVDQLVHSYKNRHFFQRQAAIPALRNVSFSIEEGTCFGLMGTSGAGKSTLGKVILGIQPPQEGTVFFQGTDLYAAGKKERREMRRHIQTVFQDSYSAVNPRMKNRCINNRQTMIGRIDRTVPAITGPHGECSI